MANTGQQRVDRSPDSAYRAGPPLRDAARMSAGQPRPPERFGEYLLVREIRAGGMAELLEAHHVDRPDEPVAIKRLLPAFRQDPEYLAMFDDEARISTLLSHRGIVRALDHGRADETPFIVLEYVDGASLGAVLRACRARGETLPIPLACHIARRLALALHHAHQLRGNDGRALSIIHRDVTPDNVLVGYDGSVKLGDFGLARSELRSTHTQGGLLKGTSAYLSPEQANLEALDARSDIFSLGIVLFEMLTGEHLFLARNDFETLERVRRARIGSIRARNPRVPVELERLARHALARLPDARFSTGQALARALARVQLLSRLTYLEADVACYMRSRFGKHARRAGAAEPLDDTGLHAFDALAPISTISSVGRGARVPDEDDDSVDFADTGLLRALQDDPKTDPQAHAVALVPPSTAEPATVTAPASERDEPDREDPTLPFTTALAEAQAYIDDDGDEPTQVRLDAGDSTPEQALQLVYSAPAAGGRPSPFPAPAAQTRSADWPRSTAQAEPDAVAARADFAPPSPAVATSTAAPARRAPLTPDPVTAVFGVAALAALAWAGWLWLHPLSAGSLRLTTEPADAHVFFDGVEVSAQSPHLIEGVDVWTTHTIAVNKPGYRQWQTTLRVRAGQTLELPPIRLPRVHRTAPPSPSSSTTREPAVRPAAAMPELQPAPEREPAPPAAERRARKAPARFGTLRINSRPWSRVHVDGRFVGNTPLARVKLRAGKHRVVLSNPKFGLRRRLSVAIRPGQVTTEVVDLSR